MIIMVFIAAAFELFEATDPVISNYKDTYHSNAAYIAKLITIVFVVSATGMPEVTNYVISNCKDI